MYITQLAVVKKSVKPEASQCHVSLLFFFFVSSSTKFSFFDRKLIPPVGYVPCPYAKLQMRYSLIKMCTVLPVKDQKSGH